MSRQELCAALEEYETQNKFSFTNSPHVLLPEEEEKESYIFQPIVKTRTKRTTVSPSSSEEKPSNKLIKIETPAALLKFKRNIQSLMTNVVTNIQQAQQHQLGVSPSEQLTQSPKKQNQLGVSPSEQPTQPPKIPTLPPRPAFVPLKQLISQRLQPKLLSVSPADLQQAMQMFWYMKNNIAVIKEQTQLSREMCAAMFDYKFDPLAVLSKMSLRLIGIAKEGPQYSDLFDYAQNYRNQQFIQCFVQDVLQRSKRTAVVDTNQTLQVLSQDIKKYLVIKKIPSSSAYGSAYFVYGKKETDLPRLITSIHKPFGVMKVVQVRRKDNNRLSGSEVLDDVVPINMQSDLIHELAVGLVLNQMREQCVNFTFTYGGFFCDILQAQENIMCTSVRPSQMSTLVITEAINDAYTFVDLMKAPNGLLSSAKDAKKQISNMLIQLAHALYLAETKYKFVHYDLHNENVMYRVLSKPTTITVQSDLYHIELTDVRFVPMIIDYGMSVMKPTINGQEVFLGNNYEQPSAFVNNSASMHELGNNEKDFYYPGFDMYRYCLSVLVQPHNVNKYSSFIRDVVEELFEPAFEVYRSVGLYLLPQLSNQISQFLNASSAAELTRDMIDPWPSIQNKEIFKKNSASWILNFWDEE
jgi:hypothetical protein